MNNSGTIQRTCALEPVTRACRLFVISYRCDNNNRAQASTLGTSLFICNDHTK
jgi:hypothetical protein